MDKLLTIAIPTYNRKKYLARLLNSIMSQITDAIEIIVSDNASTDGTEELIKEYSNIYYNKNESNIGPDLNFLKCYSLAKGKYIWILGDDDIVLDGAILKILNFLNDHDDLSLVMMNYFSFKDVKKINLSMLKPHLKQKGDIATTNKNIFMKEVKHHITFISCILMSRKAFETVVAPQKYQNTFFIHSAIAFEGTRNPQSKLGIFYEAVVGQDISRSAVIEEERNANFYVFSDRAYNILCRVAPMFGYDRKLMKHIFSKWVCIMFTKSILSMKSRGIKNWKCEYWKYGYPILKRTILAWFTVIPAYYCPTCIARFIYTVFHTQVASRIGCPSGCGLHPTKYK